MSKLVVSTAMMSCTFGAAPSTLTVIPPTLTGCKLPIATIMDNAPMVNIAPFGMCSSMANPTVSAATAAALGVLTPMPCVPATAAPWAPGAVKTNVGKKPALLDNCKLTCNWGGMISITNPGQVKVDAK